MIAFSCSSCHGDSTRAQNPAAPPLGARGEIATTTRAVGAHQSHLGDGPLRQAVACPECHVVPTTFDHASQPVSVTFGDLANTGTTSTWNGTSCATYCHGATLQGGTVPGPLWTKVDGTQAACGACHGIPPPTGQHRVDAHRSAGCGACHAGYTSTSVNAATHINGTRDLGGFGLRSDDPATGDCTGCHGQANWRHGR